jgi:small subunit ribosomal protein S16
MIRLARVGAKKKPHYRVVVIEKERSNTGRFVEIVGQYNPRKEPVELKLDMDRVQHWIKRGAQPSETVQSFLRKHKPAAEAAPAAATA